MTDDTNAVTPVTNPTDLSKYTDLSQITDMPTRKQYLQQILNRYPVWETPHLQGRPTRCTESLVHDICALLADGAYIETACGAVGVGEQKFYEWISKANRDEQAGKQAGYGKDESPFLRFREKVKLAFQQAELNLLAELKDARGDKTWARLAWILERTRNGRYGQRQEIRHTHELIAPTLPPQTASTYEEWIEHRSLDRKQIEGGIEVAVEAEYEDVTE